MNKKQYKYERKTKQRKIEFMCIRIDVLTSTDLDWTVYFNWVFGFEKFIDN